MALEMNISAPEKKVARMIAAPYIAPFLENNRSAL
jgi:hypothetical protein